MTDIGDYLADERLLVDRLAQETDPATRMGFIEDSIATGEAVIAATTNSVAAADAMISVAASYLLAANEAPSTTTAEDHARAASGWAARAVRLAEGAPGPVLHFIPRAGTIVVAAMTFVPEQTRRRWMGLIESWPHMVADAITAQSTLTRDGTGDLIVGSALLEGIDAASPDDEPAVRREAMETLRRAERSLSMAGETKLAAEARRAIDAVRP